MTYFDTVNLLDTCENGRDAADIPLPSMIAASIPRESMFVKGDTDDLAICPSYARETQGHEPSRVAQRFCHCFGGDPGNVTIAGPSAGPASVD
jgi:hypothetical protein